MNQQRQSHPFYAAVISSILNGTPLSRRLVFPPFRHEFLLIVNQEETLAVTSFTPLWFHIPHSSPCARASDRTCTGRSVFPHLLYLERGATLSCPVLLTGSRGRSEKASRRRKVNREQSPDQPALFHTLLLSPVMTQAFPFPPVTLTSRPSQARGCIGEGGCACGGRAAFGCEVSSAMAHHLPDAAPSIRFL